MNEKKRKVVKLDKIYTKTGDQGKTNLNKGGKVFKNHPRVEAFGAIDELNSLIGHVRCSNIKKPQSIQRNRLNLILETIQNRLFDLGSELATIPSKGDKHNLSLTKANVIWLENIIDKINEDLGTLDSFILPGGGELNSFLHQARTVCRRAERRITTLSQEEKIGTWILPYINRLSDALFVFSRWVASQMNEPEFLWEPGKKDPKI